MGKSPSFQFYHGDWLRDQVAGCSIGAQGLWLRLMIVAYDAERRGYLAINGVPIPPTNLSRMCAVTLEQYTTLLAELDSVGVPSYTPDGIMFSRRMVNDEKIRVANAHRQAKYRAEEVTDVLHENNSDVTTMSQPSSSSSSVFPLPSAEGEHRNVPCSRPVQSGETPHLATKKGAKGGAMPSLDDALTEARSIGLPAWKTEAWWSQMAGFGWVVKGKAVHDWRALLKYQLALWRRDGSKPNPSFVASKKPETPTAAEADIAKLLREVKADG